MCEKIPKLELVRARPKISPHAKNQPWGIPVSSINSEHINIYIHIYTYTHIHIYTYTHIHIYTYFNRVLIV